MDTQLVLYNAEFGFGKTLSFGGVPTPNPTCFSVNIVKDENNIGLRVRGCFDGGRIQILCDSCKDGIWSIPPAPGPVFPLFPGKEFKMSIEFTANGFLVKIPGQTATTFNNNLGLKEYPSINVKGDVYVKNFGI